MKTNETSKKENLILIDPPSGWKYGFPKVVTQEQYKSIKDLKQWCIDNGYSREEAKSYGDYFHIQISGDLSFMNKVNKPNQKQFKQFDESLFKAYIDKFSDEDKLKAIKVLMKATNIDICTSNGFIYR